MTKNLKYFLIPFVLSFPFFWGVNFLEADLEDIFYYQEITSNPKILAAQANQMALEQKFRSLKPLRYNNAADLDVTARSAISLLVNNQGEKRILFSKDIDERLPIASLTKLMTAYVVLENYDLSKEIVISKEAIAQEENFGQLKVGQVISVKNLLYPLLIESSNDAAFSLANDYNGMTEEAFVDLMNLEAKKLGLKNTYFLNATGLDLDELNKTNYSSSRDLAALSQELLKTTLIWQILNAERINLYGVELENSNKLLGKLPAIIGGKTGYTEEALGCFLLILEAPKNNRYLINVVLGAKDRFGQMEELINWVNKAYKW